jgi:ribosomal protein S18 acetylase RimI-like enzyme
MSVRNAETTEIPQLARIWFDAWQDAHAQILPAELARIRTLESFAERLRSALVETRVAGPQYAPVGFCIVSGDELYQLFVAASARGTGVAANLLADAEARLARSGFETAWLACAIGNERAARFYEKHGWINGGSIVSQLDTPNGIFPLVVWRYEKRLRQDSVATMVANMPIL